MGIGITLVDWLGKEWVVYPDEAAVEEEFDCFRRGKNWHQCINFLYRGLLKRYGEKYDIQLSGDKVVIKNTNPNMKVVVRRASGDTKFSTYTRTGVGGFKIAKEFFVSYLPLQELDERGRIYVDPNSSDHDWRFTATAYTLFCRWADVEKAFDSAMAFVPEEDVQGEMARVIKSQFTSKKCGKLNIKVKSRSSKCYEIEKYTDIVFNATWKGPEYDQGVDMVVLRVQADMCYMSQEPTTFWSSTWGSASRQHGVGEQRKFKLSDPDSLLKIKKAVNDVILEALKSSMPIVRSHIEKAKLKLDSMSEFLSDLTRYESRE